MDNWSILEPYTVQQSSDGRNYVCMSDVPLVYFQSRRTCQKVAILLNTKHQDYLRLENRITILEQEISNKNELQRLLENKISRLKERVRQLEK